MLTGKKIVLAISGGIAAYKAAELTRLLIKQNAEVRVVMTPSAMEFITPLTLQALSRNSVHFELFDAQAELAMGHIELAKWADLLLIAPATANRIALLAHGLANDLISTLSLATSAPIAVVPAMNQQMYANSATQANLRLLKERGVLIWGPDSGEQACGDHGAGRMIQPDSIITEIIKLNLKQESEQVLKGQKWLITAGPTREAIDPVRYLSNYSSGKMGFSIAYAAAQRGAQVTLITGPVQDSLSIPESIASLVRRIDIVSAQEMYDQVIEEAQQHDCFVSCAAVADYSPVQYVNQKMKKELQLNDAENGLILELKQTPDIVATVASMAKKRPFVVGFAAETEHIEAYAHKKLIQKKLDLICANDVSLPEQGFDSDFNQLTLFWPATEKKSILQKKQEKAVQMKINKLQLTDRKKITKIELAQKLVLQIDRLRMGLSLNDPTEQSV